MAPARRYDTGTSGWVEGTMPDRWQTFRVSPGAGQWEPASYNVRAEDGTEYGRWRRVLRQHRHGLTMISRYRAPPRKAWKIVGKASTLGEEVYIMEGHYYDSNGHVVAGPGTFMFNAPSPASRLIGTPRKRTISARGVCHGASSERRWRAAG